jgi:hypothetical protein
MRTNLIRIVLPGVLGLLLLPLGLAAQSEGYDPMLQVQHQIAKPNVLIVQDVTGSMAWQQTGSSGNYVDTMGLPGLSWSSSSSVTSWVLTGTTSTSSGCSGGNKKYTCTYTKTGTYTYTLTATAQDPSRIDVVKNALGNAVPLYTGATVTWPGTWPYTYSGWTYLGGGRWQKVVTATCTVTSGCVSSYTCPSSPSGCTGPSAPGAPFSASWTVPDYSQSPHWEALIYDGSHSIDVNMRPTVLPKDVVGVNANYVNWGLETFSTDGISVRVAVSADDTASVQAAQAAAIEAYMRPAAYGGLTVGGGTNTSQALNVAKGSLYSTYKTGGKEGAADAKADTCGRVYATILCTDGLSNTCNPSGGNWISPCGSCPGPTCCDVGSSGYNCPSTFTKFPAGRTSELFLETNDTASQCTSSNATTIPVRTFVIGVSNQVNRCELNMDAFFGRTDASSPNGDAGMAIEKDYTVVSGANQYRLPPRVPGNFKSYFLAYRNLASLPAPLSTTATEDSANYRPVSASCTTGCKDYAYFASDPSALQNAFESIVGAIAAGDYTTSAPIASSALSTGTVALLASAEFPGWKGHLYAYDVTHCDLSGCNTIVFPTPDCDHCTGTAADPIPAPPVFLWDAGTVLNSTSAASRKIYTWNSSNQLVEVTAANAGTLNSICGSCGITSAVVDFIRGNDGSGNARSWKLGSVVNSTPAVTQAVEVFRQGNLADHSAFESKYATRTPLVWVGADDGMLHAFKLSDGSEVLALLPPNLLSKQVLLKANYDPSKRPTGQPGLPKDHIYGVAGSARYGDVWFSSDSKYKTVLILTEGPGGDLVAGIDVTSPVTGDPDSYDPVILWSKTGADIAGLFKTWSTPSAGADTYNTWKGIMGAGFNPASTKSAQVNPKVFLFNPVDGSVSYTGTLGSLSSPSPWVGNQSFCDSVIYQMSAKAYYPDNLVDLGLQPDLNGRIWFIPGPSFASPSVGINATAKAGQQQPIYYPPAVSGYQNYDIYAFGSGTFYETAFANDSLVGLPSGDPAGFSPSLYLVAKDQTAGAATSSQVLRITINQDLYVPEDLSAGPDPLHPLPCSLPANQYLTSLGQTLCTLNTPVKLGQRTQLSAPPALFVPIGSSGSPVAVFLLYDPDTSDCAGTSYIVKLSFDIVSGAPHVKSTDVYGAGSGAASGFAVAGSAVVVAKSGVGSGSQASISKVPGLNPTEGLTNPTPVWWREVK